jgi:hypothetical protein
MWGHEFAPSIGKFIPPPKVSKRLYLYYSKRPLPQQPTAEELEEVQHGPQWPFVRKSRFALPEPTELPSGDSFVNAILPSDDEDDSSYAPSSSEDDSDDLTDSEEYEFVDSDSEAEREDIDADRQRAFSSPTPSEMERAVKERDDAILARDIGRLEAAEAECAAAYNPDEVVALLTQFFELTVAMGHWPEGCIQHAPHTESPVNVQLAQELGYEQQTIELMKKLPYLKAGTEHHDTYIVPQSRFADYRKEGDLRQGRRPIVPFGDEHHGHPFLDPWILPLVIPGWYGYVILLDSRLGAVRSYAPYDGPDEYTPEWKRHGEYEEEDRSKWTHDYRRAPLISVRQWLIDMIEAYRNLERLPVLRAEDNDPRMEKGEQGEKMNTDLETENEMERDGYGRIKAVRLQYYAPIYRADIEPQMQREKRKKQWALMALYRECGWPNNWRRDEFLKKWKAIDESLNRQAREMHEHASKKQNNL